MSDLIPTKRGSRVSAAGSRRTYTMTAQIVVAAEAELSDPFTRIVLFRALAAQLQAAPPVLDTPHGPVVVEVATVTAVS